MELLRLRSNRRVEIIDITSKVREAIAGSGVNNGIAVVFSFHTTTAIIINESEPRLLDDIIEFLNKLVPEKADYRHNAIDRNADAHLRALFLGNSIAVPVSDGKPDLGTWQSILFIELDGPRERKVGVKVIP